MKQFYRFRDACYEDAFKGSGDPDFYDEIEQEYKNAEEAFVSTLYRLTEK